MKHWRDILGKDEQFVRGYIAGSIKHDDHTTKRFNDLLDECMASGWLWPQIKDGALVFGSMYPPEKRPQMTDSDFVHEE